LKYCNRLDLPITRGQL